MMYDCGFDESTSPLTSRSPRINKQMNQPLLWVVWRINQSSKQASNQRIYLSINLLFTNQPSNQSISQSITQSTKQRFSNPFIHSFIHSFVRSFVHSFIHSFIHSCLCFISFRFVSSILFHTIHYIMHLFSFICLYFSKWNYISYKSTLVSLPIHMAPCWSTVTVSTHLFRIHWRMQKSMIKCRSLSQEIMHRQKGAVCIDTYMHIHVNDDWSRINQQPPGAVSAWWIVVAASSS